MTPCLVPFNSLRPSGSYMRQWNRQSLIQIMVCRLLGTKPFPEPMLGYCQLQTQGSNINETRIEIQAFAFRKMHLKISFRKWRPFCLGLNMLNIKQTSYHQISGRSDILGMGVWINIWSLTGVSAARQHISVSVFKLNGALCTNIGGLSNISWSTVWSGFD